MLMASPVIWANRIEADKTSSPEAFHNSKLAIIAAQKRSAEFALSTLQLDHERQVKEFKSEKRDLESEVSALLRNRAVTNAKAELPEEEEKSNQLGSDQFTGTSVERLDQVVKACNAVESSMLSVSSVLWLGATQYYSWQLSVNDFRPYVCICIHRWTNCAGGY
ncbi:hypothetical protein AHF37_04827 [Paragonimus kellicotti]|nr:hypothetical protein AHF37_04827 [Paragonimus kellicotti]